MGAGRSGTSMLAGALAQSYYVGKSLIPPRKANPKGFFESSIINNTNEAILQEKLPNLVRGQRWLGVLTTKQTEKFTISQSIINQIKDHTRTQGFCYKDPRFCYTLSVWRPYLNNTKFICVFRHPLSTMTSVLKECSVAPYLRNFRINTKIAENIWREMYSHVLKRHRHTGHWKFVHYEQLFGVNALSEIEEFLECRVNKEFPDKKLNRSKKTKEKLSKETQHVYKALCSLALHKGQGNG